jgi:uncharacterized coiled-coil protein SlyX
MLKLLPYIVGLLFSILMITLISVWLTEPNTKQVTDQTDSRTSTINIKETRNNRQDKVIEQLWHMLHQSAVERETLTNQLDMLQKAVQAHIEESKSDQYKVSHGVDSDPDSFTETYQEPLTAQALRLQIAQSDFLEQQAITSQLDVEEVDPEWSSWAEAEIRAVFDGDIEISKQLTNIVCLTTFCRVEGDFGELDIRGEFITKLMALVPWETHAFFHGDDVESITGALYIMKEGVTDLPN